MKNRMTKGIIVQSVRIRPVTSEGVSLRLEFYGCGRGVATTTTPAYEVENTTHVVVKTTQPTDVTKPGGLIFFYYINFYRFTFIVAKLNITVKS